MRFNQREILFIGLGSAFVLVLGLYLLVIEPLANKRDDYALRTQRLEENLKEMRQLAAEYQARASARESISASLMARGEGFAPRSYLETLARQAEVMDEIESMNPVSSGGRNEGLAEIDLRLSNLPLEPLVKFLFLIESSDKALFINNLHIRPRYLEPEELDVTLRVATPAQQ